MKKITITALIICFSCVAFAQKVIVIGKIPDRSASGETIQTSSLLGSLNWEYLKKYYSNDISEYSDSFFTYHSAASYKIKSFNDEVMEFEYTDWKYNQESKSSFFDKDVFFKYISKAYPGLSSEYRLDKQEPVEVLKAFYSLLGKSGVYGWYFEGGSVVRPVPARLAIIELINFDKRELIKKLLRYPAIETQLYAADALIYIDGVKKEVITRKNRELDMAKQTADSLKKNQEEKEKKEEAKMYVSIVEGEIRGLKRWLLTDEEWKEIYAIRDSNREVNIATVGIGSYKTDKEKTTWLLSDQAIYRIPSLYDNFKYSGKLRR